MLAIYGLLILLFKDVFQPITILSAVPLSADGAFEAVRIRRSELDVPALVDACRKRGRPNIMTTVAIIAGMIPIAVGLGADASFWRPMAIAVIGSLLTSTAPSLLVVPVMFTYVARLERCLKRRFAFVPAAADEPQRSPA